MPHLHVHVIPRYAGDVDDPGGGVRFVIPERGDYRNPGRRNLRFAKKITLPAFGTLRIATLPLLPDGVRSFASAAVCAHGIARRRLRRLHHARIPARAQPSHGHHCSHANNNLSLKGVKQRLESSGWPSPTGRCICGRPGDAAGYAPPSPRSSAAQLVRWAAGYLMNP